MSGEKNAFHIAAHDEIIRTLQAEFRDDARERIDSMASALEKMVTQGPREELLSPFRCEVHNLKGMGGSFGFPGITQISHRLETYLGEMTEWTPSTPIGMQRYLDAMGSLLDLPEQPADEDLAEMIRALPAHPSSPLSGARSGENACEILLVTPSRSVGSLLSRQLVGRGFRVNLVADPIEGFVSALRYPPDAVITSQVMKVMSGVDLVRALRSVSATSKLRSAVLTSGATRGIADLPADVPVLQAGPGFADDVAGLAEKWGLYTPRRT